MLKEELVSFEQAKKLDKFGFPKYGACFEYYDEDGHICDKTCDIKKLRYPRPTLSLVSKWLMIEKKFWVTVITIKSNDHHIKKGGWSYAIYRDGNYLPGEHIVINPNLYYGFDSALSDGIDETLLILEKENNICQ